MFARIRIYGTSKKILPPGTDLRSGTCWEVFGVALSDAVEMPGVSSRAFRGRAFNEQHLPDCLILRRDQGEEDEYVWCPERRTDRLLELERCISYPFTV